jgi:hypothetical protein
MDFPWIGFENGLIQNVLTGKTFISSPLASLLSLENSIIGGHLDGKLSIDGCTVLNLQSPISSLFFSFPFLLIGLGNGISF